MEVELIEYGSFYADGGAMFGAIPKRAWKRKYPSDEENRCLLAIRGLLIRTGKRVVVVDCGVGHKPDKRLSYYLWQENRPADQLFASLRLDPSEVTDVIFSHLHFDHCGGATLLSPEGTIEPQYPNATHWVSRRQWEHARQPSLLEADSFFADNTDVLFQQGLIRLTDGTTSLGDGITLFEFDGHTPGQLAPLFADSQRAVLFPGDIIPIAAHTSLVWISAYDIEPVCSLASKQQLLEIARTHSAQLVFCHDAYQPLSR